MKYSFVYKCPKCGTVVNHQIKITKNVKEIIQLDDPPSSTPILLREIATALNGQTERCSNCLSPLKFETELPKYCNVNVVEIPVEITICISGDNDEPTR